MNRALLLASAAALPMLVDASLKSAALLMMAGACALLMRRASASARHMVWLAAVLALLLVPGLSVVLPSWRVLPQWAAVEQRLHGKNESKVKDRSVAAPQAGSPAAVPEPVPPQPSHVSDSSPAPSLPAQPPVAASVEMAPPASPATLWLIPTWAAGCALVLLRLATAHFLLCRATRRCETAAGPLAAAFAAAARESGMRQPVRLLVDKQRTIPVVWGLFQPRVLLPAEAESWDAAQLRSVLMHELAHLRRRDPLVQFLTQFACALHWFNPLVWLAAWRLHVERERACDDLVLAAGVRPSDYASHLLHVATQLSAARCTSACGLAMARKSSLEGRLRAVLSDRLNRRHLTRCLTAAVILITAAIAVPIAMLRAAPTGGSEKSDNLEPSKASNPTWETVPKLNEILPRLDTSRDWKPADAIALLDEVAAVKDSPLKMALSDEYERVIVRVPTWHQGVVTTLNGKGEAIQVSVWSDTTSRAAPKGEWSGKLTTGEIGFQIAAANAGVEAGKPAPKTGGASPRGDEAQPRPQHKTAQALFKSWQASARTDGKIPGGLIVQLGVQVEQFTKQYPKDPATPKLAAVRPKLDASRDWTQAEVVGVLDEIAAISTAPVGWANIPMEFDAGRNVRRGEALPNELKSAAWGKPAENGLRAAWLLEPAPAVGWAKHTEWLYRLGTVLKARVLFHNTGKAPVVFETETWHQYDTHNARDAEGREIKVGGPRYTGITPMATFRLAPGEYCEVSGHGIAIGAGDYNEEFSTGAVGAIIEAKEGDTVTLTHTVDAAQGGWTKPSDPKDPVELRKQIIAERVSREAPMPRVDADRDLLIRRVTLDLTGVAPTPEEIAAFIAYDAPDALELLTFNLQATAAEAPWSGKLPTGETKFRVLPAGPNAAKAPRTATGPGRYVLGDGVHLQVRHVTENGNRTNSAKIIFFGPDPKKESPHKPYDIAFYLPDAAYAFVWQRGANTLWLTEINAGGRIPIWLDNGGDRPSPQKVTVRAFDFSNPADVQLTLVSSNENGGDWSWGKIVPAAFHQPVLDALGERGTRLRDFIEPQKEKPTGASAPKQGAQLKSAGEQKLKWGEPVNGLRAALVMHPVPDEPDAEDKNDIFLVVQNVSQGNIWLHSSDAAPNPRQLIWREKGVLETITETAKIIPADFQLQPREVAFFRMLLPPGTRNPGGRSAGSIIEASIRHDPDFDLTGKMEIATAPAGAWTGKLLSGEIKGGTAIPVAPTEENQVTPAEGEWTGTLKNGELDVKLVAADAPKITGAKAVAPKSDAPSAFLRADVKPERTFLFNDKYAAIAVQSEKGVNFVLIYDGALSSGMSETWSETSKRWTFEGNVHLVDRRKTKAAGKNVDKRVIAVKYTSDEPTTLFLNGKAYDLAATPRLTPMGALEGAPGRVFLLRDKGEPFQTHRRLALRNEKDLASIGQFAVNDHFTAELYADNRRIQKMEGWVLALDFQVPHRRSGGHRTARLRIFPDGQVLSYPNGRTLRELTISTEELLDLLRWLADDQKVPTLEPQAAQPGDPKPATAQEFDTWAGGVTFLQFKHNGKLHHMTIGSHLRNPGTGRELANPGFATFKAIGERLMELENRAVTAPVKAPGAAADPAAKPRIEHMDVDFSEDGEISLSSSP